MRKLGNGNRRKDKLTIAAFYMQFVSWEWHGLREGGGQVTSGNSILKNGYKEN